MRGAVAFAAITCFGTCACVTSDNPSPQDYLVGQAELEVSARAAHQQARQRALSSGTIVDRTFEVFWEYHTGFWIYPPGNWNERIPADFYGDTADKFYPEL